MKDSVRLAMLFAFACMSTVFAQGYPSRPIRVVVPWPPGQATDLAARMVSEKLVPVLGQPLVIDNKPGAGGTIGTEAASKTPPDGYTLLAGSSGPISISPNVQKVPYDPLKDFAAISLFSVNPYALVVNPSIPAGNVKELIALLKASPGKYSFSSSGAGASSHLASALFNSMANIDAVHVPYKGSSPAISDLVSGQVAYTFETVPAVISFVRSGRLRALAISTAQRSAAMPDLPTVAAAGDLPGYDMSGWIGLMAPAGLPREISGRLSREVRKILDVPEIKERFLALGLDPGGNTPEEYAEFLKRQNDRYASIVKQAGLKVD